MPTNSPSQPFSPLSTLGIFAALLLLLALALYRPLPKPLEAGAEASLFSAQRAGLHLPHLASTPHPIGSPANAAVRQYLVDQLGRMGVRAEVQSAHGLHQGLKQTVSGRVHNVIARLPGRERGKALMIAAHYDSAHSGPGAADDAASVAAMLEVIRALKAAAPLRNDLIFLFTDGEEPGLLGAEAFVAGHPAAKTVGLALNFEYRGNRGPMVLFETSKGNGRLIAGFAGGAPQPVGNSLMYEAYKHLPNDTDATVFKRAGMPTLNFAAVEGLTAYHTPLDTVAALDRSTLQHQGELMLGLARDFGQQPLDTLDAADHVYFDLPGVGLIHYPVAWVWPFSLAALALFAIAWRSAARAGALRPGRGLCAVVVFPLLLAISAAAAYGLWQGIQALHPDYRVMPFGDTYNGGWYRAAFAFLTVGLIAAIQGWLRRWFGAAEQLFGALLCGLLLLLAVSAALPGVSFLLVWPLIGALLGSIGLFSERGRAASPALRAGVLLLSAAPAILLFAPMVRFLMIGLTFKMIAVPILILALALGMLAPLLDALRRRWVWPALPLLAGIGCLIAGGATAGFSTAQPKPAHVFYFQPHASDKAFWLSRDPRPDAWTKTLFAGPAQRRSAQDWLGDDARSYWIAAAPPLKLAAPVIEVLEDVRQPQGHQLELKIRSARNAPQISIAVEGAAVLDGRLNGDFLDKQNGKTWKLSAYPSDADGLHLSLLLEPRKPVLVRVIDRSFGLPPAIVRSRPADRMLQPLGQGDSLQAATILKLD